MTVILAMHPLTTQQVIRELQSALLVNLFVARGVLAVMRQRGHACSVMNSKITPSTRLIQ